jgi:hypothetical protein
VRAQSPWKAASVESPRSHAAALRQAQESALSCSIRARTLRVEVLRLQGEMAALAQKINHRPPLV